MIERDVTALEAQLAVLSPAAVSGLACKAPGSQDWQAPHWRATRIQLSMGSVTGGIYRLSGTAERED